MTRSWLLDHRYGSALISFILAAILLMWVFLGLPAYVQISSDPNDDNDYRIRSSSDKLYQACLNLEEDDEHLQRNVYGLWVTSLQTIFFLGFLTYGYSKWYGMPHPHPHPHLHRWFPHARVGASSGMGSTLSW